MLDLETHAKLHKFVETGPIRERTERFKEVSEDMKEEIRGLVERKREMNQHEHLKNYV